jgi:hypothetical protein
VRHQKLPRGRTRNTKPPSSSAKTMAKEIIATPPAIP